MAERDGITGSGLKVVPHGLRHQDAADAYRAMTGQPLSPPEPRVPQPWTPMRCMMFVTDETQEPSPYWLSQPA